MTRNRHHELVKRIATMVVGVIIIIAIIVSLQLLLGYSQVKNAPSGWQIIPAAG